MDAHLHVEAPAALGTKRWTLLTGDSAESLAAICYDAFGQTIGADVDSAAKIALECSEYATAPKLEFELRQGELLFIPHGMPHFVRNVEPSVALSMNYVDESNLDVACKSFGVRGLQHPAHEQHGVARMCSGCCERADSGTWHTVDELQADVPWGALVRSDHQPAPRQGLRLFVPDSPMLL